MIRLVVAYLLERRLTTALNIILLAISVGMLVLLLQFARQAEARFLNGAEGIDLVVGAKGSPLQLVLSSVYHLDEPTGNIPLSTVANLRSNRLVASAIPLALGDQFRGFRIVGTEPALTDLYSAPLVAGKMFSKPLDTVIGAEVARKTGARIGQRFIGSHGLADDDEGHVNHDDTPFVVTGILATTGKPVDRLILTSIESVWDVHGIAHDHEKSGPSHEDSDGLQDDGEPELTAVLLQYRNPSAAVRLPAQINRNSAMQAASPARESTRLILLFEPLITAIGFFAIVLACAGGLAIFVALWNAVRAREGDLALLRVMGASRFTIFTTVVLEGVVTALLAAGLGIAAAHALLWSATNSSRSLAEIGFVATEFHREEIIILGGALILGAVAAILPAWKIMRCNLAPILARH